MSETWFTSDLHLGHDFVARTRGFDSHHEHDEELARRWDKKVRALDEVWVLGDVAMNGWADRLEWFHQRPGIKHLVLGNHDRAHPLQKNAQNHQRTFLTYFETVQTSASIRLKVNLSSGAFLMSHFPYNGEGASRPDDKDRYTQWRLRDEGAPLLHGHVHDDVKVRWSERGSAMLHVGVDAWRMAPCRTTDLADALAKAYAVRLRELSLNLSR